MSVKCKGYKVGLFFNMVPMKKDSIELEGIASSPDLEVLLVGCP